MTALDVTLPSDTEILVKRQFRAPKALIFACHTRPEYVTRWMLGPPGWTMPVCEIDLRVGGRYKHTWRSDETGAEFSATGTYDKIREPDELVTTERMEGFDGKAVNIMTLEEKDGITTMTVRMVFDSKDARDGAVATGMADGMGMSYDALDAFMATLG